MIRSLFTPGNARKWLVIALILLAPGALIALPLMWIAKLFKRSAPEATVSAEVTTQSADVRPPLAVPAAAAEDKQAA